MIIDKKEWLDFMERFAAGDAGDGLGESYRRRTAAIGSAERTIHPCALMNASPLARSVALAPVLRREVLAPRRPWWQRLWTWATRRKR